MHRNTNGLPPRTHNNPPSPLEDVAAQYDDALSEAQNWADGALVENESQMKAVDAIIKDLRLYGTALKAAGVELTKPYHEAWKAKVAEVKKYTDDLELLKSSLVAASAPFKAKLVAQKEAAKRAAYEEAERLRREADAASAKANSANVDEMRAIESAKQAAIDASKAASAASKDTVGGMRTVYDYEITNMSDVLRWMNKNARADLEAATVEYVRKHVRANKDANPIPGVVVTRKKEAY